LLFDGSAVIHDDGQGGGLGREFTAIRGGEFGKRLGLGFHPVAFAENAGGVAADFAAAEGDEGVRVAVDGEDILTPLSYYP